MSTRDHFPDDDSYSQQQQADLEKAKALLALSETHLLPLESAEDFRNSQHDRIAKLKRAVDIAFDIAFSSATQPSAIQSSGTRLDTQTPHSPQSTSGTFRAQDIMRVRNAVKHNVSRGASGSASATALRTRTFAECTNAVPNDSGKPFPDSGSSSGTQLPLCSVDRQCKRHKATPRLASLMYKDSQAPIGSTEASNASCDKQRWDDVYALLLTAPPFSEVPHLYNVSIPYSSSSRRLASSARTPSAGFRSRHPSLTSLPQNAVANTTKPAVASPRNPSGDQRS